MMIDDEFPFENILKTFSNYNRTLQGSGGFPPNRSLFCLMLSTICSDYCDLPLGSYKKKSQEEPRQDLWSSRKKISIDHVAPQVGQKYQTMIEHMYTVLTWNIYSLSNVLLVQLSWSKKCRSNLPAVLFNCQKMPRCLSLHRPFQQLWGLCSWNCSLQLEEEQFIKLKKN